MPSNPFRPPAERASQDGDSESFQSVNSNPTDTNSAEGGAPVVDQPSTSTPPNPQQPGSGKTQGKQPEVYLSSTPGRPRTLDPKTNKTFVNLPSGARAAGHECPHPQGEMTWRRLDVELETNYRFKAVYDTNVAPRIRAMARENRVAEDHWYIRNDVLNIICAVKGKIANDVFKEMQERWATTVSKWRSWEELVDIGATPVEVIDHWSAGNWMIDESDDAWQCVPATWMDMRPG